MADFCAQASFDLFGEDYGDLKGLCGKNEVVDVLCEDCGASTVDADGKCLGGYCCVHGRKI